MSQDAVTLDHSSSVFTRVHDVIERIGPAVQEDDGDVELVDVTTNGVVQIRLHGVYVTCPSSLRTLKVDIEQNSRKIVPEVTVVQQVQ